MKECKCGKIPPCYSGKKFRIHEELEKIKAWDDTHDKVYELNRQMCDLDIPLRNPIKPIKPLSEETAQELIGRWEEIGKEWASKKKEIVESIFGNITNEKSNIMEEKKTKKMTKAEAFEYLKGKKVILRTEDEQVELQRFLFNVGYRWLSCRSVLKLYSDTACMFFLDEGGLITHSEYDQESDKLFCDTHVYKETKLDDILSIEIVEEKYELEFNYDKAVELAKPLMHYLNEVGCPDGIRVSQLGIIHEPMSTLIFDNGIGE